MQILTTLDGVVKTIAKGDLKTLLWPEISAVMRSPRIKKDWQNLGYHFALMNNSQVVGYNDWDLF